MRIKRLSLGALAIACSLAAGTARAQDNPPGGSPVTPSPDTGIKPGGDQMNTGKSAVPLAHKDREFIDKAAMGGLLEVKLGQLALTKSQNPTVKQFAQHMVDDHNKVNEQLRGIAEGKGVMLPTMLDNKAQGDYDKLSKLDGAEFDRAYLKRMVEDHDGDISDFQKEADGGKDADLKQFARQTLPTLKMHNDMAKRDRRTL